MCEVTVFLWIPKDEDREAFEEMPHHPDRYLVKPLLPFDRLG
jgi:hypothetical protein